MSARFRGIGAAILSVFFSSSYSIFSKYLLQRTIPETLILISQVFSVIAVLLFFGLIPEMKDIWKLDKKMLIALCAVALFSGVLKVLFFMKGLTTTLAINAIVVSRLSAIFLGVFGFTWLQEKFTWKRLLGTGCMFAGVLYIVMEGFTMGMSVDTGVIWVGASALMSAGGSFIYKKYLYNVLPEVVLFVRYGLSALVFLLVVPMLIGIQHDVSIGFSGDIWIYFVGMALIAILFATYLRYEALDHAPASLVGAIDLLKPLSGMILAYIFLGEGLYLYHLWGTLLLVAGLVINLVKNIHQIPQDMLGKMLLFKRHH